MATRDVGEQALGLELGRVGRTRFSLQVGDRPWAGGLDLLVVSVGGDGLGSLAQALLREHPEVEIGDLPVSQVTPEAPMVSRFSVWHPAQAGEAALTGLLLVTLHPQPLRPATLDVATQNLARAARAAVAMAGVVGSKRLGLPLVGAGLIGIDPATAARELLDGALRAVQDGHGPDEVVLTVRDQAEADAVVVAWQDRVPQTAPPEAIKRAPQDPSPDSSPDSSPDTGPQVRLSSTAWDLLRTAVGSPPWGAVGATQVVAAAMVRGTTSAQLDVARALRDRIEFEHPGYDVAAAVVRSGMLVPEPFRGTDDALLGVTGVAPLVARAQAVARATRASYPHARHLLAAAVLDGVHESLHAILRTTDEQLLAALGEAVRTALPGEWGPAWVEVLAEPPPAEGALAGGMSADLVRPDRGLAASDDHLGVSTYVGMMATVVARADTPLPLSIGLFGEWGSGKSTFMGLLRGRVDELSRSGSPDYLRDVVQIGFNAWTYADANLWASLGDEIFRNLIGPEATDDDLRREVRRELDTKLGRADELEAARDRAVSEATKLQGELDRARTAYVTSLSALGTAAGGAALSRAWSTLKVTDVGEQGRLLADEVRDGAQQAQVLRRTLRHPQTLAAIGLALGSTVAVVVGAAVPAVRDWVAGVGAAGLVAGLGWLTAVTSSVRTALTTLAETAADLRGRLDDRADESSAAELRRLGRAEARVKVAQAQLDEVLARAGELRRQLVDLEPGQRLYSFLSERASSRDYAGELGLVSTIRRDFERLRDVLADWRAHHTDGERGIDRIVLYIDDLDRCSPKQVVEVLQAVHLLLALDLFVVVVGVDPRWLLHSLRQEYREVLDGGEGPAEDDDAWLSTPGDYVEKIFNVPFVLPGMTGTSFEALVRGLGTPAASTAAADVPRQGRAVSADAPAAAPLEAETGSEVASTEPAAGGPAPPTAGPAGPAGAPDVATGPVPTTPPPPPSRPITEAELALMSALAPLVKTPRQAKRMLNVYRMLRSTQDLGDASAWLGDGTTPGDFEVVAVLLGLLTRDAQLLGEVLFAPPVVGRPDVVGGICVRDDSSMTWPQALDGLEPRRGESGTSNAVAADLTPAQARRWSELVDAARSSAHRVHHRDLAAFRVWGPHVARFSFLLSAAPSRS